MSLLVECLIKHKCFRLDLKVPRVSLSVTVHGREFQVTGAEQLKAHLLKAVLENGWGSVVAEDECRVRQMSRALMCRQRYDSVEVVQTLNVNTANLYDILCLTSAADGVVAWYVTALAPVKWPELHCFEHTEACRCCWWERHGAEDCSSRVLIGPGYMLATVRVPSSAGDVCGGWPVYGNCTIAPQLTRACQR